MNKLDLGYSDIIAEKQYLDCEPSTTYIKYNLPWIEKYRPLEFTSIISHHDILNALTKMIQNKNIPHLMFYGPPGIGKTTTILTCAKKMYGENYKNMILELNGSEDRGINVVREQIKDFSMSKQFMSSFTNDLDNYVKLVILDEADSMTSDAQFALRRIIENYTSNIRFCIICNYDTKIISAIKSRCMIFRFSPIPKQLHLNKIIEICNNEEVKIDLDAIKLIVDLAEGDMRKSINLIQIMYTTYKFTEITITKSIIYKQIGYPTSDEIQTLINILFDKSISLLDTIQQINYYKIQYNITTSDILKQITDYLITIINNNNTYNIVKILDVFGNLENNMATSYNDNLMLANIISCVKCNI